MTTNYPPYVPPYPQFQITLNLESEEDVRTYLDAPHLNAALSDMSDKLRSYCKYGLPEHLKTPEETVEHIRQCFFDILADRDVKCR